MPPSPGSAWAFLVVGSLLLPTVDLGTARTGMPAQQNQQPAPAPAPGAPAFQAFSKYDFVPGEKVIALDDFTQDEIGDFPARWNTNGSGEIVAIAGKPGRWLKLTRGGYFTPEFVSTLPDNVTIEFDLIVAPTFNSGIPLYVALGELSDVKEVAAWQYATHNVSFTAHPGVTDGVSDMQTRQDGESAPPSRADTPQLAAQSGNPVHISIWRQRQRLRVYFNEAKVWDVPRALAASAKLNALVFFAGNVDQGLEYHLANLRVAAGAPDARNKLLTEGKWATHGILFDVNSDRIKGESYGTLKEIAGVLTENVGVKVQIVGHTDADGDEAANMDLSKRRAAAVKAALTREFGIDPSRMETDGKGESQPVDKNDNPAGKANNRRVEFIRK
jgi:outer membrane protein OmpA-like peptidoglycan-associated protein